MPPRKTRPPPKRLRQTTLLEASSPIRAQASTSKSVDPPTRTASKRRRVRQTKVFSENEDDDDSSQLGTYKLQPNATKSDTDSEVSIPRPSQGKKRRKVHVVESSDSDDKPDIPKGKPSRFVKKTNATKNTATSSRKAQGKRPVRTVDSEEESSDEVDADKIIEKRLRTRGKLTAFQKNLEKLKRKKQGKPVESTASSNEDEESGSGSNNEDQIIPGARPSSDRDSLFDGSSEDDDNSSGFIVEDDGTAVAALPAQFSMDAHQDLAHQFKKVFQFFVHIAVHPAPERHDYMTKQMKNEEYFSVPLQVARRNILGLRDSLVASSVWRPDFKRPLDRFPDFDLIPLEFAVPSCDACHLGGRMSTLIGRLSGFPYDRLGFENQDSSSSEDDSDDDDDAKDRDLATVEFHLGRFCARRTRVYHELTHWEFSLFKIIRQEVDDLHMSQQSGGFFRIAYIGGKEPPEDLDDADGICDWLDERSVIDMEWQKLKALMESARHLEIAAARGDAGD